MPDTDNPFAPKPFTGAFADAISGAPPREAPQQPGNFSGYQSKSGKALGLIDNFLAGISKGKVIASARNEQKSQQAVKDADNMFQFMMSSDTLSKEGKEYIEQGYLKARAQTAKQRLAEQLKAMPKDQKDTPQSHVLHALHSSIEAITGGPTDKQQHGPELMESLTGLWKTASAKTGGVRAPGATGIPAFGRADTSTNEAEALMKKAQEKVASLPEEQRYYALQQTPEFQQAAALYRKVLPERDAQARIGDVASAYKPPYKPTDQQRDRQDAIQAARSQQPLPGQPGSSARVVEPSKPSAAAGVSSTGQVEPPRITNAAATEPPRPAPQSVIQGAPTTDWDNAMAYRRGKGHLPVRSAMVNGVETQVVDINDTSYPGGAATYDATTHQKIPSNATVTAVPKREDMIVKQDAHGNVVAIDKHTGKPHYVTFDDSGKEKLVAGVPKSQAKVTASDGSQLPATDPKAWKRSTFTGKPEDMKGQFDGLTLRAMRYLQGEHIPATGKGGQEAVTAVTNRAAQLASGWGFTLEEAASAPAIFKANSGALSWITKQDRNFGLMESTLNNNSKTLKELSDKYNRSGEPFVNAVTNYLKKGTGDADVVAFMGQLEAVVQEVAAVQSASTGSGKASVSDKRATREVISAALSKEQLDHYIDVTLKNDIANKRAAFEENKAKALQQLKDSIHSGSTTPIKAGEPVEPPKPKSKIDLNKFWEKQ